MTDMIMDPKFTVAEVTETCPILLQDLAKLGKFLTDVATLKKSRTSKSTLTAASDGNAWVTPEQSAEEMKAKHAALEAAEHQSSDDTCVRANAVM
jgi:hypothetical protein